MWALEYLSTWRGLAGCHQGSKEAAWLKFQIRESWHVDRNGCHGKWTSVDAWDIPSVDMGVRRELKESSTFTLILDTSLPTSDGWKRLCYILF